MQKNGRRTVTSQTGMTLRGRGNQWAMSGTITAGGIRTWLVSASSSTLQYGTASFAASRLHEDSVGLVH